LIATVKSVQVGVPQMALPVSTSHSTWHAGHSLSKRNVSQQTTWCEIDSLDACIPVHCHPGHQAKPKTAHHKKKLTPAP